MASFDIVSRVDMPEVGNAVNGARRELATRYDFKGSKCAIEHNDDSIILTADDEFKMKQVQDLLFTYCAKRKVDTQSLESSSLEKAAGDTVRQSFTIKQGIEKELAQKIVKSIKASKIKVQASIQGEEVRVSGKKRDDLQQAIQLLKETKHAIPLQCINFRD
jgi:cyclic-di-GMP-binding protein